MIDLIIPYYNNLEGLERTLASIDTSIFYVTVVDDHSPQSIKSIVPQQIFRYNTNRGPGFARQHGLNKTSNPYIMFLDTGDIFISLDVQQSILTAISNNPNANIISFSYYYKDKLTYESDNRMHGKIYKREFLDKYGITFTPDSSYINEDIGFNRVCKICAEADGNPLVFYNLPIIKWIEDENSLTQKNNGEFLYKDQTLGLAKSTIHTVEICRKNGIDPAAEINQIAIALYYWFIRTAAERPEFLTQAWNGVKFFYDRFATEIKPNQLAMGNAYLKKSLKYKDKIWFPINILRFVDEIWNNKNLPDKYLTFDEI